MLYRTGTIARKLGKSREVLLEDLRILGIEPQRDSAGHRLLTEDDVQRLLVLHKERRRRQRFANARYNSRRSAGKGGVSHSEP